MIWSKPFTHRRSRCGRARADRTCCPKSSRRSCRTRWQARSAWSMSARGTARPRPRGTTCPTLASGTWEAREESRMDHFAALRSRSFTLADSYLSEPDSRSARTQTRSTPPHNLVYSAATHRPPVEHRGVRIRARRSTFPKTLLTLCR